MLRPTERRAAPKTARTICLTLGILALGGLFAVAHAATIPKTLPGHWSLQTEVQSGQSKADSVPGSNTIVDLVNVGGDVWAATGRGASKYSQSAQEWVTYGVDDGLAADEVPALHIVPGSGKIWVATSHSTVVDLQPVPYGDGLFLSTDGGATWQDRSPQVPVGALTLKPASGPFQICYDITSFRGRVVAACFAGGLVISGDDGLTWQNIYASREDSVDYANRTYQRLNNRFFSVAVDTTNTDTLALYAGSAAGINKFVYLDSSLKIDGFAYRALAEDDGTIYAGTDIGISKTSDHSLTWRTSLARHGIPTDLIGAVAAHGDTIWVGADAVYGESGAGLAFSFDGGKTWSTPATQPEQTVGSGNRARAIVSAAGAWWVACEHGGLIRSADLGATWDVIFPDRVNAIAALSDGDTTFLWAGIDSGVVRYTVPKGELPVESSKSSVGEGSTQNLGQRIINLGIQDSPEYGPIIWTMNTQPPGFDEQTDGFAVSADTGQTWRVAGAFLSARDVAFTGNYFWLLTDTELYNGIYPYIDMDSLVNVAAVQSLIGDNKINTPLYSLETEVDNTGDQPELVSIWVGSDSGLAFFPNASSVWDVVLPNTDPLKPDTVIRTYYLGADSNGVYETISGNFITALERQERSGHDYIWAATQTTGSGQANGIARSINGETDWTVPLTGHFVWNFAFDENEVWVASSEGLLHSTNNGGTWDTLTNFIDRESGASIAEGTEIYAVDVVGDEVWLGTDNGFVVLDKNDPTTVRQVRRHFEAVPSSVPGGEGGAYATPVPFSENFHPNGVRFHFIPPVDGPVTVSIFDFANNLVKEFYVSGPLSKGVQYDEAVRWDGRNGKGDRVAIGAYFFTIEYANGAVHWGKLAVIY